MAADDDERAVLVLTPSGRDATLVAKTLEGVGIATAICRNGDALAARVAAGASAAVVAEEALTPAVVARLVAVLSNQPPWSDFPFLIFTERTASARENERVVAALADLGNVSALERPLHPMTLISAVRAALRARAHQFGTRAALEEREREVRQRDQFLAMLGHELRNPLGAIRNAAHLAQREGADAPGLQRFLEIIDRQIHHLTRLVDDLLDVARVTTGKIALQRAPTDLRALCLGLTQESRRASREGDLDLCFRGPDVPVIVLGDRVRLEQVVNNLLTNAFKYTPAGGRVTVSIETSPSEAVLRVSDTGTGISAEILPTIFEPFTQSARTLDRAQGGMGLGLSVVRTLVGLHGGSVTATSEGLGHGAELTVRLPLAPAAALAVADVTALTPDGGPPRLVLVVEDGPDNRETLRELLELLGHEVETAADGVEGVERALALRPDIALVDIGLPLLDGFEVARLLRAELGASVFLVALTGYGQPEDRARALAAGFDLHLTKPLDLAALERTFAALPPSAPRPRPQPPEIDTRSAR